MTGLKEKVLALPISEKQEILEALQMDLADEVIADPILDVLRERSRQYRTGEMIADPAEVVFQRLLQKYPGESDHS